MFFIKSSILITTVAFVALNAKAQKNTLLIDTAFSNENKTNNKKQKWVLAGSITTYAGLTAGLYSSWYRDYEFKKFHFVNDNKKWLQVDKAGHAWSGYIQGRINIPLWQHTGIEHKKAVWIGGLTGFAYMNVVEIMDGFSSGWGFSWGDYIANIAGSSLLISQELAWKEQKVLFKFSYYPKQYNGQILQERATQIYGEGFSERLLNDYNGHIYWLSVNPASFLKKSPFPRWLNIALGYGADGMLGEATNVWTNKNGIEFDRRDIKRYRQLYISPDLDLSRIKTNSKLLKKTFFVLNCFKFPAPAIEFSNNKAHFRWLGF